MALFKEWPYDDIYDVGDGELKAADWRFPGQSIKWRLIPFPLHQLLLFPSSLLFYCIVHFSLFLFLIPY